MKCTECNGTGEIEVHSEMLMCPECFGKGEVKSNLNLIIGQVWHKCSDLAPTDVSGDGYSIDVLIDLDGERRNYSIGWYDFEIKRWAFHDDAGRAKWPHSKWTWLPLRVIDGLKLEPVKI